MVQAPAGGTVVLAEPLLLTGITVVLDHGQGLVSMLCHLERLDVKAKEALGDALLKPLRRSPTPTYGFWSLTRLGARALIYGPLNAVIHPEVAQAWLDSLVGFQPGHDSERLSWAFCLAQLARRSGQRALDVDDGHCQSVLTVLRSLDARYKNLHAFDWARLARLHPEWFGSDGVHPTSAGYRVRASGLAWLVKHC